MRRSPAAAAAAAGSRSPTMLSKNAPRRCQSFLSFRKVIMWDSSTSLAFCRPKKTQRRVMPLSISDCLTMFSGSLSSVTTFCCTISCSACSSVDTQRHTPTRTQQQLRPPRRTRVVVVAGVVVLLAVLAALVLLRVDVLLNQLQEAERALRQVSDVFWENGRKISGCGRQEEGRGIF